MTRVAFGGGTGKLGRIVCDVTVSSDDMILTDAAVSYSGGDEGKDICPVTAVSDILGCADVCVDLTSAELLRRPQSISGIGGAVYRRHRVTERHESGVHSMRAVNVIGDHVILFSGNKEALELGHSASGGTFAEGCMKCIWQMYSKKNGKVHGMKDVLGI